MCIRDRFNTPGANANAVKELVLCGMLLASRGIVGGIEWCKENAEDPAIGKTAEKAKKQFAGREIKGCLLYTSRCVEETVTAPMAIVSKPTTR